MADGKSVKLEGRGLGDDSFDRLRGLGGRGLDVAVRLANAGDGYQTILRHYYRCWVFSRTGLRPRAHCCRQTSRRETNPVPPAMMAPRNT
jgi:hypothetical protein